MRQEKQTRGATNASGGTGWARTLAYVVMLAGVFATLMLVLRKRPGDEPRESGRSSMTPPIHKSVPPLTPDTPAPPSKSVTDVTGATRGKTSISLTELWVLDGDLQATIANEGNAPARAVNWAIQLSPGYDADNDYGGGPPPSIEITGGHHDPINVGDTIVVTLAKAPTWYLDVHLHPMQLRARYHIEDGNRAPYEIEQDSRLVLFHVRSENELNKFREQYLD